MSLVTLPAEIILQITKDLDLNSIVHLTNISKKIRGVLIANQYYIFKDFVPDNPEDDLLFKNIPIKFYDLLHKYDQVIFKNESENIPGQYQKLTPIEYLKTIHKFKISVVKILETIPVIRLEPDIDSENLGKENDNNDSKSNSGYPLMSGLESFLPQYQRYAIIGRPEGYLDEKSEIIKDEPPPERYIYTYDHDPEGYPLCRKVISILQDDSIPLEFWDSTGYKDIYVEGVQKGNFLENSRIWRVERADAIDLACMASHPTNILKFIQEGVRNKVIFKRFIKMFNIAFTSRRVPTDYKGPYITTDNQIKAFLTVCDDPKELLIFRDWDTLDDGVLDGLL